MRPYYKYDSVIVDFQHFALFASWIDKKNDNYLRNTPYNFNLLYRSSSDGNTIAKFHEKTSSYGPIFGSSHIIASCCDIELRSNGSKWSSYPNCYPDIDIQ
jgi:hypothetical protein